MGETLSTRSICRGQFSQMGSQRLLLLFRKDAHKRIITRPTCQNPISQTSSGRLLADLKELQNWCRSIEPNPSHRMAFHSGNECKEHHLQQTGQATAGNVVPTHYQCEQSKRFEHALLMRPS